MQTKNKMKICFFGDAATQHIRRWSKFFADKGHEVHVITFNPDILENYGTVKVHLISKKFKQNIIIWRILNMPIVIFKIMRLIKRIKPDIIHAHSVVAYSWLPALFNLHPLIITPWGGDIFIHIHNSRIEKFLTKFALKRADLITCDGAKIKNAMVDLGIDDKKIIYIYFGTDIKKFKPSPGKNHNSKIVISTRIFEAIRDVATFIRAIPLVLKKIPDAQFLVVSYGPQQEYLMDLSRHLKVQNSVKFTGRVSQNKMVKYLQMADIYVCTTLSDSGLAASTAEAMACQLPIINTDTGDVRYWLKHGKGGFIIPAKRPEIVAKKIIYLLKNQKERVQFGRSNRQIIVDKNNYYKEMATMENIYKKIKYESFNS